MITITERAVQKIKEMMQDEGKENIHLRIGVIGGGCSGLTYSMGFDEQKWDDDVVLDFSGLPVRIDKESAPLLRDITVDYKENMLGGGFTIDNPNAIATCGCGSSFRTKNNPGTPTEC